MNGTSDLHVITEISREICAVNIYALYLNVNGPSLALCCETTDF